MPYHLFGEAIAVLNSALKLLAPSIDLVQVVVSELIPLLFDFPFVCFQFPSTQFQSMLVLRSLFIVGNGLGRHAVPGQIGRACRGQSNDQGAPTRNS
jgi:Zn-dependent protease with chaperone function